MNEDPRNPSHFSLSLEHLREIPSESFSCRVKWDVFCASLVICPAFVKKTLRQAEGILNFLAHECCGMGKKGLRRFFGAPPPHPTPGCSGPVASICLFKCPFSVLCDSCFGVGVRLIVYHSFNLFAYKRQFII